MFILNILFIGIWRLNMNFNKKIFLVFLLLIIIIPQAVSASGDNNINSNLSNVNSNQY